MSVEGSLDLFSLPEILQMISQQGKTGILTIQGQQDIVAISFLAGRIVAADSLAHTVEEGLAKLLVSEGLLSAAELARAVAEHHAGGGRLLDQLVERRYLTRPQLLAALRLQTIRQLEALLRWQAGDFKFYGGDEVSYEEGFEPISVEDLLLRTLADFAGPPSPAGQPRPPSAIAAATARGGTAAGPAAVVPEAAGGSCRRCRGRPPLRDAGQGRQRRALVAPGARAAGGVDVHGAARDGRGGGRSSPISDVAGVAGAAGAAGAAASSRSARCCRPGRPGGGRSRPGSGEAAGGLCHPVLAVRGRGAGRACRAGGRSWRPYRVRRVRHARIVALAGRPAVAPARLATGIGPGALARRPRWYIRRARRRRPGRRAPRPPVWSSRRGCRPPGGPILAPAPTARAGTMWTPAVAAPDVPPAGPAGRSGALPAGGRRPATLDGQTVAGEDRRATSPVGLAPEGSPGAPLPSRFRQMQIERPGRLVPLAHRAAAAGLAVAAAAALVMAARQAPERVLLSLPWEQGERAAFVRNQRESLYGKIETAAKTACLRDGRFPDQLAQLRDAGLLSPADLTDPGGEPLLYSVREDGYTLQATEAGKPLADADTSGSIAGNFLLDPAFSQTSPQKGPPIVVLD